MIRRDFVFTHENEHALQARLMSKFEPTGRKTCMLISMCKYVQNLGMLVNARFVHVPVSSLITISNYYVCVLVGPVSAICYR